MGEMIGTIQAVSQIKSHNDVLQIGFMIGDIWHNIKGSHAELDTIKKTFIKKGNTISFEIKDGFADKIKVVEEAKEEKKEEDDLIDLDKLLSAAHKKFKNKFNIQTELLEKDMKEKWAVFKAVVTIDGEDGKTDQEFYGHGDATQENVSGDHIKKHFLRMAETRAICRALRWATNNASAAEEEK